MAGAALSTSRRSKWAYVTTGILLIALAVALTVFWQIIGAPDADRPAVSTARWVLYLLGSTFFLLLIGGLVLIVLLLLREVRLNERQSNFISAVTHELKTPVASLKLYLDTLQLRDLPEARREEFYKTMRHDVDRLHETINTVLNAAMYADRPVVEPQPVDLADLARHAIELTRNRHRLDPETASYRGPEHLHVRGDAAGLETALLNLLDNAVKYAKDGHVAVEVELARDAKGNAQIHVRDQGIGMSRTHLRFVFNRFYRIGTEVRRSRPGTGLGLFIVRSVVKGHRGKVQADSPGPDRGSTFTITLPGVIEARTDG